MYRPTTSCSANMPKTSAGTGSYLLLSATRNPVSIRTSSHGPAKALGVTPHELKNPDTGIRTGVDCLRRFRQGFGKITDPVEKIKFTLAAYNAGIGHIYDAQRLAEKYGKDPYVWDDNVAEYIRMKNDPEYYNDPVCKHGYLRGSETFNYVREVMERYNYYLHKTGKK